MEEARRLLRIARGLVGAIPRITRFVDRLVIDDYPYGRERTQATFEVDGSPGKQRVCRQTIDPKSGRRNKPKCTTFGVAAKIGVGSDGRTYPVVGRPGQIQVWSWDMKHTLGSVFSKDSAYNDLAEALGFRTVPGRVTVKETPQGAAIDGLQGRRSSIRELMNLAGLPNEVVDEQVKTVKRERGKGTEAGFLINFIVKFKPEAERDDFVIKVYT